MFGRTARPFWIKSMDEKLDYEKLEVWQKSMQFASDVIDAAEELASTRNHYRLIEQPESAVTSIPQNIAEGKGRYSKKEFIHFLYISRGSLYETLTIISIFRMRKWIGEQTNEKLKKQGTEIARMLNGLINAINNL